MKKLVYAVLAAAIILGIVFFLVNSAPSASALSSYDGVPVSQQTIAELHAIANNESLAATAGVAAGAITASANALPLAQGGKSEVLFIGADYCPYCATVRWGLILALMRFGNFSNLYYMTSSAVDVFPNTPTFSFYNTTYSSPSLYFRSIELTTNKFNSTTNSYPRLQNMTANEQAILYQNDRSGSIPFVDFANSSVAVGSVASPQILDGNSWDYIISQLRTPDSPISQAILGAANIYTAEICKALNNTAAACAPQYIRSIE